MISKISFSKLVKENIRHRGWLAALSAILLFLFLPALSLLFAENAKTKQSEHAITFFQEQFPGMLNGISNAPLAFCIGIIALLCAVTGFAYLHSQKTQDFYHGMPVTRIQWFLISYVSGLVIFMVPYIFFGLCTLIVIYVKGMLAAGLLSCLLSISGGILAFLICYHIAILAMFLTGQTVTGILAALTIFSYGIIIQFLCTGLRDVFLQTWTFNTVKHIGSIPEYISPVHLYFGVTRATVLSPFSPAIPICTIIVSALFLGAALYICKHYPAEVAGNALTFSKSAAVIKVLAAVPTALFAGALVQSFNRQTNNVSWLVLSAIFAVAFLCLLIEFIYHHDLKKLLAGKISSAVSLGSVILILCILHFDLFGFDSYLPEKKELDSISFNNTEFTAYFQYPDSYLPDDSKTHGSIEFRTTDTAPFYPLADEGIQNLKQGISPDLIYAGDDTPDYIPLTLNYHLKGGKDRARTYALKRSSVLEVFEQLCENADFRKQVFPIFHLDRKNIQKLYLEDIYHQAEPLPLNEEQQNELLDAYETDVLAADITDLEYELPLGELSADIIAASAPETSSRISDNDSPVRLGQFYVYDSYKNTLALLSELGCTLRSSIAADDVVLMNYYPNNESEDFMENTSITNEYRPEQETAITDPKEVEQILKNIRYDDNNGILNVNTSSITGYVEITLTQNATPNFYAVQQDQ